MRAPSIPRREAIAASLLLALLVAGLALVPARPGPGPLPFLLQIALLHAALVGPAVGGSNGAWAALGPPLALPCLVAVSYGHDRTLPVAGLLILASLAGAAGRALKSRPIGALYLPTLLLVFFAPYGLHYLVAEFGRSSGAEGWRLLSPLAAADALVLPPACALALFLWPAVALAARRRR